MTAPPPPLLLFLGDSWAAADRYAEPIQRLGERLGVTAVPGGGNGFTACRIGVTAPSTWAQRRHASFREARVAVILSGINDLRDRSLLDQPDFRPERSAPLPALLLGCWLLHLKHLFSTIPSLHVVQLSYDLLCTEGSMYRWAQAACTAEQLKQAPAPCYHSPLLRLQRDLEELHTMVESLMGVRPEASGARSPANLASTQGWNLTEFRGVFRRAHACGGSFRALNVQGAMQAAGGIAGAAAGHPVEDVFAPTRFFDRDVAPPRPEKLGDMSRSQQLRWNRTADFRATAARDCLHPTVEGYSVLLDAVARRYLQPQLARRPPERCGTT